MNANAKMVRCCTASDALEASLQKQFLEARGIPVRVDEGAAALGFGELPRDSLNIDVWVPEEQLDDARKLLVEFDRERQSAPAEDAAGWKCESCGADNEAGFDLCYRCEEARRTD